MRHINKMHTSVKKWFQLHFCVTDDVNKAIFVYFNLYYSGLLYSIDMNNFKLSVADEVNF